jgi:ubiquinone biosynthesis protein Coq4
LPHGTLGRGYIEYLETNRFPLPGERGAVSDIILPHDLAHVLGGYSTAPADEVLVASFSAGHRLADPFAMVMFVLFQFHLGLRVTPGAKAERGLFDPASVLDAIVRGSAVTFDLTSVRWDYWMDMPVSLDELRARFNIVPRTTAMPRAA